ncbi:MAG TPA: branched-chain amino acid ABC transporter substrate-binding protein [bacterium (Candidatus Stahlbacteria)]|nr:branched-chain amino acid ABC transporter substrate-binding protein [Candidatus Stahlbacteria bacterium]
MKNLLILLTIITATCVQPPVKIAVVADLSGTGQDLGWSIVRGVELAIDEYNEHSMAPDFQILIRDDHGDSVMAKRVAQELARKDIIGVIGHMNSHCSMAAAPIYHQARIPMITPSSTAPILTEKGYDNVFRICGRDDLQGRVAALFVRESLRSKRILLIADNSIYGRGLADAFEEEMGNNTIKRINFDVGALPVEKVRATILLTLPDLVYFSGLYQDGARLLKILPEGVTFLAGDGVATDEFLKLTGKRAEGIFFTFGLPIHQLGSAVHFLRVAHEKKIRVEPYTCNAYDATNLLIDAYFRARGKDLVWFIKNNKFDGAIGIIQFNKKGDLLGSPFMVWTVKNGTFTPWTKEVD